LLLLLLFAPFKRKENVGGARTSRARVGQYSRHFQRNDSFFLVIIFSSVCFVRVFFVPPNWKSKDDTTVYSF